MNAASTLLTNQLITEFVKPYVSEGWMESARAIEMADLVRAVQPDTIVEVGVFGGRSLIAQALALKEIGKGKIYGIDSWKKEDALEGEQKANRDWWEHNVDLHSIHRGLMESIWRLGLDDYVVIIRASSHRVPKLFPGGIQILNLDGNHSEAASLRDAKLYVPQLNTNGYVWIDDMDWQDESGHNTTKKAVDYITSECVKVRVSADGHYGLFCRKSGS